MSTRAAREGGARVAVFLWAAIVAFLFLAFPKACHAEDTAVDPKTVPLASEYNLTSTSYIYCYTLGNDFHVRGNWVSGVAPIKTTGSSTTTVSKTASTAAFTGIAVGDELMLMVAGLPVRRYVTAVASVDSITVNTAWNLASGTTFFYRNRTCASTITDGWFRASEIAAFSVEFKLSQLNATSVDFDIECRADDAVGTVQTIWTKNYTATGGDTVKVTTSNGQVGDECRAGMKVTGATGAQKITINLMTR